MIGLYGGQGTGIKAGIGIRPADFKEPLHFYPFRMKWLPGLVVIGVNQVKVKVTGRPNAAHAWLGPLSAMLTAR